MGGLHPSTGGHPGGLDTLRLSPRSPSHQDPKAQGGVGHPTARRELRDTRRGPESLLG